ncbi:MAG: hypothetical protein J3K34DRAFT_416275 [Monoraphidium minutum]|nr:MAG: hypothetical protein J3K34DRAFT_416275 [Monoraphidium minutum]
MARRLAAAPAVLPGWIAVLRAGWAPSCAVALAPPQRLPQLAAPDLTLPLGLVASHAGSPPLHHRRLRPLRR